MDTNSHESKKRDLLFKDEVYRIVGCAFEVLKEIGHGLHEKPYENALAISFRATGIPFEQQPSFPIYFKGECVGEFVPDLIAYEAIVVETKVIPAITDHERGQLLNYLRVTGKRVGVILNFHKAKLEWERIVF